MSLSQVQFSVLMPVYAGTPAEHFELSVQSLLTQQLMPLELILIEDGPLTPEHERVLSSAERELGDRFVRLSLRTPVGIADALQAGLAQTTTPWVARMDADDIARADRFAIQAVAAAAGIADVIGSAMTEFETSMGMSLGDRVMPTNHEDIARLMKSRNPLNHPTVFMRRDAALAVGGYRRLPGLEDYDLWARMLASGARFANLEDPLVAYRVDSSLFRRRRGVELLAAELRLQCNLVRYGLIGWPRAVFNTVARTAYRILPICLMRGAYRHLFRSKTNRA